MSPLGALPWMLVLATAGGLSPTEQAIRTSVKASSMDNLKFVEQVARINSGTLNPQGVRAVGVHFEKRLAALGFETQWIEMPPAMKRAGHLFARRRGKNGKRLLLIGHLDTVFEPGDGFDKVVRKRTTVHGPGVFDMKAGDVVIVAALEALHEHGLLADTTITVALIGDEEKVGSPKAVARKDLIAAAKESDIALGFEPGLGPRHVSIARRGSSSWRMTITAKGGHSSMVGSESMGHGAIYETARMLEAIRKLFEGRPSLTINPGLIVGGTNSHMNGTSTKGDASGKNNKVAASVHVSGDLRFLTEAEKEEARTKMRAIAKAAQPHAYVEIKFFDGYPAMPPTDRNRAIFDAIDRVNRDLGYPPMELVPPEKRGAADISFVAPYVAALAGVGPNGRGAHTKDEELEIDSLRTTTERTALLLYRLTR